MPSSGSCQRWMSARGSGANQKYRLSARQNPYLRWMIAIGIMPLVSVQIASVFHHAMQSKRRIREDWLRFHDPPPQGVHFQKLVSMYLLQLLACTLLCLITLSRRRNMLFKYVHALLRNGGSLARPVHPVSPRTAASARACKASLWNIELTRQRE